jgi:hypothetical protein
MEKRSELNPPPEGARRRPYRFLLDRDVSKTSSAFPKRRTRTVAEIGLADNASDAEIVRAAWNGEYTIITANGGDVQREILKLQSQTKSKECHELRGLVVLPSGYENQRRLLHKVEQRLRFGNTKVAWFDVSYHNLIVRITLQGRPEVRRLPRCSYCQKREEKS